MKTIGWHSPAKINLFLYVTKLRSDGYHDIQTFFQLLNYGDIIYISSNTLGNINLLTHIPNIPNSKNIIIRAAKLLKKKAQILKNCSQKTGANIYIKKNIPIGGGLGGGSSNAATILLVLNKLWKTEFTLTQLANFGKCLGSDIPLFIMGNTALAEGTGNILYPIHVEKKWYLITYPKINISTKKIFSCLKLKKNSSKKHIYSLLSIPFKNDFEQLVKKNFLKLIL